MKKGLVFWLMVYYAFFGSPSFPNHVSLRNSNGPLRGRRIHVGYEFSDFRPISGFMLKTDQIDVVFWQWSN